MSQQEVDELLDSVSTLIGSFSFDKAKDILDREREATRHSSITAWANLVNSLSQLAIAERQYMALMFLANKSFLRKDSSAKVCYDALSLEYQRVVDSLTDSLFHRCLKDAYGQLLLFVSCRLFLLEFYEKLWLVGSGKVRSVSELVEQLQDFAEEQHTALTHPKLAPLKALLGYEIHTLLSLLKAQQELERWRFLTSLMHLNDARTHLNQFSACVQSRESRRLVFLRVTQEPELLQWFQRLRAALLATFSLYFRDVLSRQTSASEFKALCAKATTDHYSKMLSFQRKSDASLVALVYDGCHGDGAPTGLGYVHPERVREPAQGQQLYPAIVCCARADVQAALWPGIIVAVSDPKSDVSAGKVVCLSAEVRSHFLLQVSPLVTLVVVFETKRSEKDSYVTSFLLDMAASLRASRIYLSLRSGAK